MLVVCEGVFSFQVAAVCDFFMHIGHIQKGIIKADSECMYSMLYSVCACIYVCVYYRKLCTYTHTQDSMVCIIENYVHMHTRTRMHTLHSH